MPGGSGISQKEKKGLNMSPPITPIIFMVLGNKKDFNCIEAM
jgi:hypothetical protein